MPNWCNNCITGPRELLKELCSADENGNLYLDFNKVVPMPKHQPDVNKPNSFWAEGGLGQKEKELYGRRNWYDWSVAAWGSKWNASDSYVDLEGGYIVFDTAWSPPENWFAELVEKYPDHKWVMDFDECGMCFRGELVYDPEDKQIHENDLSWHYEVDVEECPECGHEYMYTGRGDDDNYAVKRCEECGHEVYIDEEGNILGKEKGNVQSETITTSSVQETN